MQYELHQVHIDKNRGKEGQVILLKTELREKVMKTKTKMEPKDVEVCRVPKDACISRVENWRSFLKDRDVRILREGDAIIRLDVWINEDDVIKWDSQPVNWPGKGWVPFYFKFRPLGEKDVPVDQEPVQDE